MSSLSRLLAVGLLALVAATWKLWTPQGVFPQVPLIRAACDWPGWFDWVCLGVLASSATTLLIAARRGWWGRGACVGMAVSLAGFFVLDQHRLQPWAWQFFLLAILLSLADDATARRGWQWLAISIYFWSAVSKLDYTFFHVQGPALLGGLKQAMGLHGIPNQWTRMFDIGGSVCLALGEMSVALLLACPRSRWLGLWAATIMHLSLLVALGPFGLNHSNGVLLWNMFFIVQNWLLFREAVTSRQLNAETAVAEAWLWLRDLATWPSSRQNRFALSVIGAAMIWPALEPFGYCDHWLAWAVYSARADEVYFVRVANFDHLPLKLKNISHWDFRIRRRAMAQWSLDCLGVPTFPEDRFQLGVLAALVERYDLRDFDAAVDSSPDRLDRSVTFRKIAGIAALNHQSDTFFWNARPRLVTFAVASSHPASSR
jgi:hypothetical protein